MRTIKIVVFCATGIATSTLVAMKLEKEFKRRGVPMKVFKGRVSDSTGLVRQVKPDLIVATAVVKKDMGVPLFSGIPLLSGKGEQELFTEIFKHVDKVLAGA